MAPICKFHLHGECTNPRCQYAHPIEYPMYIFSVPGIDIHPDELRFSLMMDPAVAGEVDHVWIKNYMLFCQMRTREGEPDIAASPEYFCRPFDVAAVRAKVARIRSEGSLEPVPEKIPAGYGPNRQVPSRRRAPQGGWEDSWESRGGARRGPREQAGDFRAPRESSGWDYPQGGRGGREYQGRGGGRDYQGREGGRGPRDYHSRGGYSPAQGDSRGYERKDDWGEAPQRGYPPVQGSFARTSSGAPAPRAPDSPDYSYHGIPRNYPQ